MKKLAAIGAVVICITAYSPSNSAAPPTVESKIAALAKVMSTVTPKKLSEEMSLDAVMAEGPQVQGLVREGARFRIDGISPSGEKLPPLPICLT